MRPPALRLALVGAAATAITYGPARMGFGLFLPEFGAAFAIGPALAGQISSAAFIGFLVALPAASVLTSRHGPRAPVTLACAMAAIGMALVAAASTTSMLAVGVVVAGASAGLSWSPYNASAGRWLYGGERPTVLSRVSTGTTVGMAAAGAAAGWIAISGIGWRTAWWAFAAAAALAGIGNALVLGGPQRPGDGGPRTMRLVRELWAAATWPLILAALALGLVGATYVTFAADRFAATGPFPSDAPLLAPSILFVAYGLAGLAGMWAGALEARLGLPVLLAALFAACALSYLLLVPGAAGVPAIVASAAAQGVFLLVLSAVLSFWSQRACPGHPTPAFTGVIMVAALGGVVGPAATGIALGTAGPGPTFGAIGGLSVALGVLLWFGLRRPVASPGSRDVRRAAGPPDGVARDRPHP